MSVNSIAVPPHRPGDAAGRIHDLILVGGGLANSLIAWRLLAERPGLDILVIERGTSLGGNHTWSFHEGDVSAEARHWLQPLINTTWTRQCVHFPGHSRVFDVPYHAIASGTLNEVVGTALGPRLLLGADVAEMTPSQVRLADQRALRAKCVIDGRGADRQAPLALGYQKFVGLEVETEEPHGETIPVIMDATVPQLGGYRFFYTLPFSPTRILIEDTYYTDGPELDAAELNQRVRDYATAKGWRIREVVREEKGVLPVVLAGDMDAFWARPGSEVPRAGLRASLFHPTTGYSLPDAVALADRISKAPDLTSAAIQKLVESHARVLWRDRSFFRLLNRMLFIAARPDERVTVMERFYRLPRPLIERFFAAKLTMGDKAQILMGRPPVSLTRAAGVIGEQPAWAFARRFGEGNQ